MNPRLLLISIGAETDIVLVRKRTRADRRTARLRAAGPDADHHRGLRDRAQRVRIRRRRHSRVRAGHRPPTAELCDQRARPGKGIADLRAILAGSHNRPPGMGLGLLGAQRLMDEFHVDSRPGAGTTVRLAKRLPPRAPAVTAATLRTIIDRLAADGPPDAMAEIRHQNQQILEQMDRAPLAPGRTGAAQPANCRTPTAASSRCMPSWTNAPTICAAPTS